MGTVFLAPYSPPEIAAARGGPHWHSSRYATLLLSRLSARHRRTGGGAGPAPGRRRHRPGHRAGDDLVPAALTVWHASIEARVRRRVAERVNAPCHVVRDDGAE